MTYTVICSGGSIHHVQAETAEAACTVLPKSHSWRVTHVIAGEFVFEKRRYQHDGLHQYWQLNPKPGT